MDRSVLIGKYIHLFITGEITDEDYLDLLEAFSSDPVWFDYMETELMLIELLSTKKLLFWV